MANLRSTLRRISHELGLKGQYSHDDVIGELRLKHADLIAVQSKKLEDMALRRMLCDVEAKQPKEYETGQGDFFPELAGFPESYDAKSLGLADKRGVRILLQLLDIKAVRAIANFTKPMKRSSSTTDRLKSLLDDLAPYITSDDEVFGDVVKRTR